MMMLFKQRVPICTQLQAYLLSLGIHCFPVARDENQTKNTMNSVTQITSTQLETI